MINDHPDRLVELCCKRMASHYDDLPPNTLDYMNPEFVLRICRRLNPFQLCKTEYLLSENNRIKLWKRLGRKLKLKSQHQTQGNQYRIAVLTNCFELLVGRKNDYARSSSGNPEEDDTSGSEWIQSIQRLAPMVPKFCLRNPTIHINDLTILLSHLKSCQMLDLSQSLPIGKHHFDKIVNVLKHRNIYALDLSECGMTTKSIRYLCMRTKNTSSSSSSKCSKPSSRITTKLAVPSPLKMKRINMQRVKICSPRFSPRFSPCFSPIRPSLPADNTKKSNSKWNTISTSNIPYYNTLNNVKTPSFSPRLSSFSTPKKELSVSNISNCKNNNRKNKIPSSTSKLPSLHLKLNKNPSLGSSCSLTTQYLLKHSTLSTLSLALNPKIREDGARVISEWMLSSSSNSMTWLDMSGCDLDADGIQWILNTINACPMLLHVNVSNNIVDGRRSNFSISDSLHNSLFNNTSLTSFNISDNALWESEIKTILTIFQHNFTLHSLNMQRTNMKQISDSGALDSMMSSSCSCSLSSLNIARNGLSAKNISIFFSPSYLHRLTSLILDGNMINDRVARLCGEYLEGNESMRVLKMRRYESQQEENQRRRINNKMTRSEPGEHAITCTGFIAIINGARSNTNLTSLDVSGHSIRNKGCIYLSDIYLETNIKYINLSYNRIGDRGVTPLAIQLQKCKMGMSMAVELCGNPISNDIASIVASK